MNLLPLGTIIEINNHKVCIIGYSSAEKENGSEYGYFVVSYPLGFTNVDKMFFIPHSKDFKVIAEGYKTVKYEKFLKALSKSYEILRDVPEENLRNIYLSYKQNTMVGKEMEE